MDERITAAKQHASIMENLRLPREVIDYVNSIEEGSVGEWIYICALDGIPLKALEKLGEARAGDVYKKVAFIRSERQKYLKRIYGDNEMRQNIEDMFRQVKSISEENQQLRGMLEASLKDVGKMQENKKKAYELEIKEKECQIRERDRRLQELESLLREMKEKEDAPGGEKGSREEAAQALESPAQEKKSTPGWFRRILGGRESKAFIESYLKDESYSPEQREYLLECFENGTSLNEIRKFAAPGMTVDIMERLRKNLKRN